MSIALGACGGGGGGSSGGNNGGGTATTTSSGAALLAAYTIPSSIAAEKVTNYATPFSVGSTFVQSNCQLTNDTSTTVYVTPNFVIYATNGVSDKAQALAADLAEQGIAKVKAYFGLDTSTTGYDGTNRIDVCVDNALGVSQGETGTGLTGQGSTNVLQVMSADSTNFDARYPNATGYTGVSDYGSLYTHELTHVFHNTRLGLAQGGLERWFEEGLATNVVGAPLPSKATVMGYIDGQDLITAAGNQDMSAYSAYQAIVQYVLQGNGGLGFGATNIPAFLDTVKADATATCALPIQPGITKPAEVTAGMPTGYFNDCYSGSGVVDPRVTTAFDTAFNATFKNSDGTPLLLHTADGANSLEATVHDRLNAYLN